MNSPLEPNANTASHLEELVTAATRNVLETMFFVEPEDADTRNCVHQSPRACSIQFSGACSGELTVTVDGDLLRELTESFLGDTDLVTGRQQDEVLQELTNMLSGSTLSEFVPNGMTALTSPRICDENHDRNQADGQEPGILTKNTVMVVGRLLSIDCSVRSHT